VIVLLCGSARVAESATSKRFRKQQSCELTKIEFRSPDDARWSVSCITEDGRIFHEFGLHCSASKLVPMSRRDLALRSKHGGKSAGVNAT
jgi:hypothetical protein